MASPENSDGTTPGKRAFMKLAIETTHLVHDNGKLTCEFSHGMKKKLALAAALIPDPDLLFLDEAFEGVDAVACKVLRDTLKRCVERGTTVFLTSHVLEIGGFKLLGNI